MPLEKTMITKAMTQLCTVLKGLDEFKHDPAQAEPYAEKLVDAMAVAYAEKESFRDQLMGVLANIRSLDGELTSVGPSGLATMNPKEMLSAKQRQDRSRFLRKRIREQIVYDATSMLCTTCKLVRPSRLNLNQLGLDSEENGTHFEYNFDNLCQCTSSSSSSRSSSSKDSSSTAQ